MTFDLDTLAARGVHTLLVQFTDLHGVAKGKLMPLARLGAVVAEGAGFSGPSIAATGLPRCGPRAEYYARGDIGTVMPLPWLPGVARIVGDGFVAGEPFDACPRQVLKRALAPLAAHGWGLKVGIEPEFFLLAPAGDERRAADAADRLDKPSYDLKSLARQLPFLHDLREALETCGLEVLQLDHEDAHGQYEVNFAFAGALESADRLMLFKLAAHAVAERHGLLFSLMPKPFADQPGSGLHCHVSLWPAGGGPAALPGSAAFRGFVAGVLAHSAGLCALAAPTVNSYKRLGAAASRSGSTWVPACIAHGADNRTTLIRTLADRFEWRLPDSSANPYLALAGLAAAGLDGLRRSLDPGPGHDDDLTLLSPAQVRERGIGLLPRTLDEALDALEADPVLCSALGSTLVGEFVGAKRQEALEHAQQVSEWEFARYAGAF